MFYYAVATLCFGLCLLSLVGFIVHDEIFCFRQKLKLSDVIEEDMTLVSFSRKRRNNGGDMPRRKLYDDGHHYWDESYGNKLDGEKRNISSERSLKVDTRPTMYTFYVYAHENSMAINNELLEAWNKTWDDAGWKTRILTMEDAYAHDGYVRLKKLISGQSVSTYNKMCFYRWLAMANVVPKNGGWMSDMDTFPLYINPDVGWVIPNRGKFTCHDGHVPALLSGSKSEWNRMAGLIMDTWNEHDEKYTDMLVLRSVQMKYGPKEVHVVGGMRNFAPGYLYKSVGFADCSMYRKRLAVHFSHASNRNCFYGGWLEAELTEMYPEANLTYMYRRKVFTPGNEVYTATKNARTNEIKVYTNGRILGNVYDLVNDKLRARSALKFLEKVKDQCLI